MSTIGDKLEALYMLPGISKRDYDLLEPAMNAYKVYHKEDIFTDKHIELITTLFDKYFELDAS